MADRHLTQAAALLAEADEEKGRKRLELHFEALIHAELHVAEKLTELTTELKEHKWPTASY